MAQHMRFHYTDLTALREDIGKLGASIPLNEDVSILATPAVFGRHRLPNRLAILPMEGCDGEADGRPGELTFRRYLRFAGSGAGLLWVEACAVAPEGRANPRQLWITRDNIAHFAALVRRMREGAEQRMGAGFRPLTVLQLTHAGRYSKPAGCLCR